jgi:hypothetical protein
MAMTRPTQLIVSSALTAVAVVLFWFKAPLIPSLVGALTASLLLLRTNRRPHERDLKLPQLRS